MLMESQNRRQERAARFPGITYWFAREHRAPARRSLHHALHRAETYVRAGAAISPPISVPFSPRRARRPYAGIPPLLSPHIVHNAILFGGRPGAAPPPLRPPR